MTNTSLETQTLDESVLEGLSPADLLADPFGIILQAMDTPGFVQQVLQTLATDLECQLLGLSAAEATYLAAYLQAMIRAEIDVPDDQGRVVPIGGGPLEIGRLFKVNDVQVPGAGRLPGPARHP